MIRTFRKIPHNATRVAEEEAQVALITQQDLEVYLQIDFDDPADATVAALIAQAQDAADSYCNQPLEEQADIAYSFEVDQPEAWHVLPRFPVSAAAVTEDGTALLAGTDYRLYQDGRLRRLQGGSWERSWTTLIDGAAVVYTAGWGVAIPAPEDLKRGITAICARFFAGIPGRSGAAFAAQGPIPLKTVELEGSDSITYAIGDFDPAADVVATVDAEAKSLLAPYMRRVM